MSQIAGQITETTADLHAANTASTTKKLQLLQSIYAPVKNSLSEVENTLQSNLRSDTPWVDQLLEHSWMLSGKRMRPVLLLLSGLVVKQQTEPSANDLNLPKELISMAAAVEMIHTATLVHDDVIDKADTRRHKPTANAKWDNRTSVLLGDYLFTHAFHVGSKSGSVQALAMLAAASNKVCAGEMKQNFHAGHFDIGVETYYEIISEKTAELCAVSCAAGALLAGADEKAVNGFEQYGRDLGMAFQIIDDVLDLVGDPKTVGKTLGTDLVNRKPTLPIIHCLSQLSSERKMDLLQIVSKPKHLEQVLETLNNTGSIDYARQVAQSHIQNALTFANSLGGGTAAESLLKIAEFVLKRSR